MQNVRLHFGVCEAHPQVPVSTIYQEFKEDLNPYRHHGDIKLHTSEADCRRTANSFYTVDMRVTHRPCSQDIEAVKAGFMSGKTRPLQYRKDVRCTINLAKRDAVSQTESEYAATEASGLYDSRVRGFIAKKNSVTYLILSLQS